LAISFEFSSCGPYHHDSGIVPVDLTGENLVEAIAGFRNRPPQEEPVAKARTFGLQFKRSHDTPGSAAASSQTPLIRFSSITQSGWEDKPPRVDVNQSHGSLRAEIDVGRATGVRLRKGVLG
jgi:hypothetical protein